jgi:release factor glutamine methyltransferase
MKLSGDLLRETATRLGGVLGEYALPYAERIFEHLLGCTRSGLYASTGAALPASRLEELESIVQRCCRREPLDYILGNAYFFDREFVVSPAVLIPRPDTETLIEQILRHEAASPELFADIGTGSGIIAAILTEHRPAWTGVGIDCSEQALGIARRNRRSSRQFLVCCDLFSAIAGRNTFDFIVSNPPYIKSGDITGLDESVKSFEPHCALDGGADGLDFYRAIERVAPMHLRPGGRVYCEIGCDQAEEVSMIFADARWCGSTVVKDLGGRPRVFSCRLTGAATHD